MAHSLKSNNTLYLFLQTHTRDTQGQRKYHLADARNPYSDNSKYHMERPQTPTTTTERVKPQWTFPTLNQPVIDFLHRSLNGCYSPICNSNEFHYKGLEHTERDGDAWPMAGGEREKEKEKKDRRRGRQGCHSGSVCQQWQRISPLARDWNNSQPQSNYKRCLLLLGNLHIPQRASVSYSCGSMYCNTRKYRHMSFHPTSLSSMS